MRVVSGKAKGTKLVAPKGDKTRPTLDKTKEALFSILFNLAPDLFTEPGSANCLDLCAGSGQIGIEALSRGFAKATFVESARPVKAILQANLEKTHLMEQSSIRIQSVQTFLQNWQAAQKEAEPEAQPEKELEAEQKVELEAKQGTKLKTELETQLEAKLDRKEFAYELIYCDPPYRLAAKLNALVLDYAAKGLLAKNGILVLEQASETPHISAKDGLSLVREQVYGLTRLCFYMWEA